MAKRTRKKPIKDIKLPNIEEKGLDEVLKILYKKSNGRINGATKSYSKFRQEIKETLDKEIILPVQIGLFLTIRGTPWYCIIKKSAFSYDYYIPLTREEEEKLKKETGYYN